MRLLKLVAVAACIIALSVAPAMAAGTIKVGAILSVTGPASFLGAPEAKTLEMLVSDINAKGGVNGTKIELIVKDSGGSPEKAVSLAKQLIDEEKVFAILGPSTSGETMAIKNLAEESKTILLSCAAAARVPAGHALAVDRERFSRAASEAIQGESLIEIVREEVSEIPATGIVVIASGPLTSPALSESIARFAGAQNLYFYDAISPIVDATTIDRAIAFPASRYGKGGNDYLNAPMTEEEYTRFYQALASAESLPLHPFEKAMYFEGCLPIEELARRGPPRARSR